MLPFSFVFSFFLVFSDDRFSSFCLCGTRKTPVERGNRTAAQERYALKGGGHTAPAGREWRYIVLCRKRCAAGGFKPHPSRPAGDPPSPPSERARKFYFY